VLLDERIAQGDNGFAELRIMHVPAPVRSSEHGFKYSLSLVVEGVCVLRFDNEAGKGDHFHRGAEELPYRVRGPLEIQNPKRDKARVKNCDDAYV
jgi:hypothetical protein